MSLDREQARNGSALSWPVVCEFLTSFRKDLTIQVHGFMVEVTEESLSGALLWVPENVIVKKWSKVVLLLDHWKVKVTVTKVSQGRATVNSQENERRRGAFETGSGGRPWMGCHCLLLIWLQVFWEPLAFRRKKVKVHAQEQAGACSRESPHWNFLSWWFLSFLCECEF